MFLAIVRSNQSASVRFASVGDGCIGLTENDGHETDGSSKLQDINLYDIKIQDIKNRRT